MIRYGVIGTSVITEHLIGGASQYPQELSLRAVYSRSRERGEAFACRMGAERVYTALSEMLSDDALDMVYVASPNACHMDQCRAVLESGKHVLCEKPLSASPDQVAELQSLAREKGLLFREAMIPLYQPQLAPLCEAVTECGRISAAHFQFCQLSSKYEAYLAGECPNIFDPHLHAGTLMDLGVYCVYPAVYLFGEPQSVEADASFLRTGADGAGNAILRYPDFSVALTYSKIGQGYAPSEIVGDKGSVTIGAISKLEDVVWHRPGQPDVLLCGATDKDTSMGYEIVRMARDIPAGRTGEDDRLDVLALEVSRTLAAIRKSAGIVFPGN